MNDEKAIRNLVDTWMAATRRGDFAAVLDLIADDAVFLVAGQEPFGKDVFRAAAAQPSNIRIDGKSDIQEMKIVGNWAFLRNHLEVTMTPVDVGEATRRSGYTLTILRKNADGRWVLFRDANLLTPMQDTV